MALKIRLSRGGAKKNPHYRIVVADARSPRDGRFIERVGTYHPLLTKTDERRVLLKEDRIRHWLGQGAQPTDRTHRFLSDAGILERKEHSNLIKAKPRKKALERIAAEEEKKKAVGEAAAVAAKPVQESDSEAVVEMPETAEPETVKEIEVEKPGLAETAKPGTDKEPRAEDA